MSIVLGATYLLPDKRRCLPSFRQLRNPCVVGDGTTTFFRSSGWTIGWRMVALNSSVALCGGALCAHMEGHCIGAAKQGVGARHWGALTVQVLLEYVRIWELIVDVHLSPAAPDKLCWRRSSDQQYSTATAYGAMFIRSTRPPGAKQLWKTGAPPRVKFLFWLVLHGRQFLFWLALHGRLFWLVLHGRCWTAARRNRHGLQDTRATASSVVRHRRLSTTSS